jgi:hypothetical protein
MARTKLDAEGFPPPDIAAAREHLFKITDGADSPMDALLNRLAVLDKICYGQAWRESGEDDRGVELDRGVYLLVEDIARAFDAIAEGVSEARSALSPPRPAKRAPARRGASWRATGERGTKGRAR